MATRPERRAIASKSQKWPGGSRTQTEHVENLWTALAHRHCQTGNRDSNLGAIALPTRFAPGDTPIQKPKRL